MAVTPDGNQPGGIVTGNSLLSQLQSQAAGLAGLATNLNEFDAWRERFSPANPLVQKPAPKFGDIITGLSEPGDTVYRPDFQRELERYGDFVAEVDSDRDRLERLARAFYGREPSAIEMQKFWQEGVAEAEAADQLGMIGTGATGPSRDTLVGDSIWGTLQRLASDEDRPGAGRKPTTSTSTSTSVSLTDPDTAQGIIQTALRDALGRRATDDEVQAFTATLTAIEQENATVSTTTSTTDVEGNTTSQTATEGGSPSAAAIAQTWLDEELNAEIDVHRAGTEYFRAAQALAGGIA